MWPRRLVAATVLSPGERRRLAAILAKFAEIGFWVIAVGPFVASRTIAASEWWLTFCMTLLFLGLSIRWSRRERGGMT